MKTTTKINSILVSLVLTGCATTTPDTQLIKAQNELTQVLEQNNALQAKVDASNADLQRLTQLQTSTVQTSGGSLLPPNAKPGECYARVLTPATYTTETKEVIAKEAAYRLEVSQPTYEWGTERILVQEESEVAELIPAKYEWRTESILIKDAVENLKTIPASYETKTEKILIKQAYTTWKKGRGPIEKLDGSTGEIMCLVEIPAEYRTVSSKILVTPARVEKSQTSAIYKDVKKRVMVAGPTMAKKIIPAVYKTIKVKKVKTPGAEKRIEIPAVYQTVTNRIKATDSALEWRNILCETNTTGSTVRDIQRALLAEGHNPGKIDGVIGSDTMSAVKSYQSAKNLAIGSLTFETLKSLGVRY